MAHIHASMQHPVVLEFDAETGHYTATVPGIPAIVVDAKSERSALKLAAEAIVLYRADGEAELAAKVVSVDV